MLLQNSAFCNNIRTANKFEIAQVGFDSSSPQTLGEVSMNLQTLLQSKIEQVGLQ